MLDFDRHGFSAPLDSICTVGCAKISYRSFSYARCSSERKIANIILFFGKAALSLSFLRFLGIKYFSERQSGF